MKNMYGPNLRDISMIHGEDFPDQSTPQLTQAERDFQALINDIKGAYNIPLKDINEIKDRNTAISCESQALGFSQGFRWAVYLLTEHTGIREDIRL